MERAYTYREIFLNMIAYDIQTAKAYLDSAAAINALVQNDTLKARLYESSARYHYYISDYKEGAAQLQLAIEVNREIDNRRDLPVNYNALGIFYKYLGKPGLALESFQNALRISEQLGQPSSALAPALMNIGKLHAELGDLEISNTYYRRVEAICGESGVEYCLAITRSNMATNLAEAGNYREALQLYQEAVPYFESENLKTDLGEQYNLMASVYLKMDSLPTARTYLEKALEINRETGELRELGMAHRGLGDIYFKEGNYRLALERYQNGLGYFEPSNSLDATKPLSVKPPIGGHITYIADYSDPMFFFSRGKDGGLGNDGDGGDGGDGSSEIVTGSFGFSHKGNLLYEPTQPLEEIVRFDAHRVYGGTFPFWNVFEASGLRYETKGFSGSIFLEELLESDLTYDYRLGINGELEFTLDITSFISFGFPMGAGSTAVVAEAGTDGTLLAKEFVNGWVDPDLSWWPEMIPVKPGGQLKTSGYADQTGKFEIGLSGGFEVEMPSGKQGLEGTLQADNEALTLDGQVTIDDTQWSAHAEFTKEQTRLIASPPENFASGIPDMVTKQIDDAIALTEQALEDLEAANEAYEFELSLRGLRTAMPAIIDRAKDAIDDAVDAGIESGRDEADKILKENNRVLCDDNIDSKVKGLVKPYRDALDRLEEAVANSNDNAQTRAELEDALRDLAGLKRIDKSVTVKIEHGSKTFGCGSAWKLTANRTIRVTKTILSSSEVDKILEAADNVQYIAEADGIRFDAQQLVDELPVLEELENLKNNVEACVSELTEGIGDVGFEFNHATREFRHFMFINGEEKEVGAFNIFSGDQLISNARLEVGGCTATEEYAKLMGRMKY